MRIAYSYGYYTITGAKLHHGFMYQATLLGGYPNPFSNDEASGTSGGHKNLKRFGCFGIWWFQLGSWTSSEVGSSALKYKLHVQLKRRKEFDNVATLR